MGGFPLKKKDLGLHLHSSTCRVLSNLDWGCFFFYWNHLQERFFDHSM